MIHAGRLAIVEIAGKQYYEDVRLEEYRNVNDFSDRLFFRDVDPATVKQIAARIEQGTEAWEEHAKRVHKTKRKKI